MDVTAIADISPSYDICYRTIAKLCRAILISITLTTVLYSQRGTCIYADHVQIPAFIPRPALSDVTTLR